MYRNNSVRVKSDRMNDMEANKGCGQVTWVGFGLGCD